MKDYSSYIGIIGGGIAGLSAGCALELQGIKTIVFERTDAVSEYGAGISISPNALRVLDSLGIKNSFINQSCIPSSASFNYLNKNLRTIGSAVVTSSRQTLIKAFHNRYIELGGQILFDHECKEIHQDACEITFADDQSYKVKHILACDGIRSNIRQKYFLLSSEPIYSGYSAWRGIGISNSKKIEFHLGSGSHIVSYPIDNNGQTSFVGIIKTPEISNDSWKIKGSKASLLDDFKDYDNDIFSMLNSSEDVYKWSIFIRPPLKSMYVKNITLLGDAAHPMVPFLGQGGCMAIEDAYVFAALAKKMDCDFDKAQNLYQKIRMQRANKIQAASMFQAKLNHLENPIAIFFRNLIIRYTSVVSIRLKGIWDYDVDKEIKKIIN